MNLIEAIGHPHVISGGLDLTGICQVGEIEVEWFPLSIIWAFFGFGECRTVNKSVGSGGMFNRFERGPICP